MDFSHLFKVGKELSCPLWDGNSYWALANYAKKFFYNEDIPTSSKETGSVFKWVFLNIFFLVFNLNLQLFQFNPIYPGSLPRGHTV